MQNFVTKRTLNNLFWPSNNQYWPFRIFIIRTYMLLLARWLDFLGVVRIVKRINVRHPMPDINGERGVSRKYYSSTQVLLLPRKNAVGNAGGIIILTRDDSLTSRRMVLRRILRLSEKACVRHGNSTCHLWLKALPEVRLILGQNLPLRLDEGSD